MKAGTLNDLQECVELAMSSNEDVELIGDAGDSPSALFLMAFSRLILELGEQDYPGEETNWPKELGLDVELFALWNFDYYQLSLRLHDDGSRELVVLRKYENEAF